MKKILVTEDEPEIRELLSNYLTHEGYEVSLAEDGVEAVSVFSKGNFDLYENRPFAEYIIGSPAFWTPYFTCVSDYEEYKDEYGYFERNETLFGADS